MQDLISREAAIAVIEKELQEERASLIGNKVFLCTVSVLESVLQEIRRISTPWISVKDRLPDASGFYFAIVRKAGFRSFEVLEFRDTSQIWLRTNGLPHEKRHVSHWMPFPDPPAD